MYVNLFKICNQFYKISTYQSGLFADIFSAPWERSFLKERENYYVNIFWKLITAMDAPTIEKENENGDSILEFEPEVKIYEDIIIKAYDSLEYIKDHFKKYIVPGYPDIFLHKIKQMHEKIDIDLNKLKQAYDLFYKNKSGIINLEEEEKHQLKLFLNSLQAVFKLIKEKKISIKNLKEICINLDQKIDSFVSELKMHYGDYISSFNKFISDEINTINATENRFHISFGDKEKILLLNYDEIKKLIESFFEEIKNNNSSISDEDINYSLEHVVYSFARIKEHQDRLYEYQNLLYDLNKGFIT